MGQVKDIACSVWRRLKGAAASLCSAVTGPARGAHSAHGGPSAPDPVPAPTPAPRACGARPARARSSRGAHTASSRRRRVIAARGAHSAPRAPRPSVPVNLQTAPAAARGYSMAEVLATVAIILILGSLVVMNVVSFQANLRQKALDAKAEIIYTAAQEQMTRIVASGREGVFAAPVENPPAGAPCYLTSDYGVSYVPTVDAIPGDNTPENSVAKWQTCYITSGMLGVDGSAPGTKQSAANLLFGSGGLDDELLNNHWVIEYDYKSLTVHAVYYSEGDFDCGNADAGYPNVELFNTFNYNFRSRTGRLESASLLGPGAYIGYHGGGSASTNISYSLDPSIKITNGEKLTATIKCTKPQDVAEDLAFLLTLEDSFGNTNKTYFCMGGDEPENSDIPVVVTPKLLVGGTTPLPNASFVNEGLVYTLSLTLDSLEGDGSLRFNNLYGKGSDPAQPGYTGNNKPLVEGSDISVKVQVVCKKNPLVETGYAGHSMWSSAKANSLFDDRSTVGSRDIQTLKDGVAGISCGRHLQNLGADSGVVGSAANINSAVQHANIDFSKSTSNDADFTGWSSTYDSGSGYFNGLDSDKKPRFKPIVNTELKSYNGKPDTEAAPFSIARLNINESGSGKSDNAALFGSVSSDKSLVLKNIALTGSTIVDNDEASSVGGLVAVNAGTLTIDNCQVYLNPYVDLPATDSLDPDPWLEGATVGGLVGTHRGSKLEIMNSSASTVAHGTIVGGLVGSNAGSKLNISTSYSDSYLKASQIGGLVGSGNATVLASYSAGYIAGSVKNAVAAGLVNGGGSIRDSYTVCTTYGEYELDYHRLATSSSAALDNVHYLKTDIKGKADEPGGAFTDKTKPEDVLGYFEGKGTSFTLGQVSWSKPYNLMGQGLDSYTWPSVNNVTHYGDWLAGFQAGSLVYFEKYRIVPKSGASSYCYGFEGAGVKPTLVNDSVLKPGNYLWKQEKDGSWTKINGANQSIIVVGDGYGVVYKADEDPNSNVVVEVPLGARDSWEQITTQPVSNKSFPVKSATDDEVYYLFSLNMDEVTNTTRVNEKSFYLRATIGADRYFFNPHFAKTVTRAGADEAPVAPKSKEYIYLRTGRQLNKLSLYYAQYRDVTKDCVFFQQRDIAFTDYEWSPFASVTPKPGSTKAVVTAQQPIGKNLTQSFQAEYDGGCNKITDVSFVTASDYAGLFGYVDRSAKIRNVVLCTDYTPVDPNKSLTGDEEALESLKHNYYVQRTVDTSGRKDTVHMGVLAGFNAGSIDNCATAGYFLSGSDGTVHAYTDNTINLGGLVGTNRGSVSNCSADSPRLRLSAFQATAYAAGFVGNNEGTIDNSYALGAIDVVEASGSKTAVAGFAGKNSGQISSSYCATAIASSGLDTMVYGFAPVGGATSSCSFLNGGTYTYISRMYSFNFDTNKMYCAGDPIRYDALKVAEGAKGYVDAGHSFVHSQTKTEKGNDHYPFRGVVKDGNKELVHYGNWQDDVLLGTLGVFYWEHEEGSGNSGYHMTYLGSSEDEESATPALKFSGGTSLCNSHDDGGVISEYGYGVYVLRGQEHNTTLAWNSIASGSDALKGSTKTVKLDELNNSTTLFNSVASEQLQQQMENTDTGDAEFSFFAFTTRVHGGKNSAGDYLYLDDSTGVKQNGAVTLEHTWHSGEEGSLVSSCTYTISPFFANAMCLSKVSIDGTEKALPSVLKVKAFDDREIDCLTEPGFASVKNVPARKANQYEVRSLQQLQYINWHARELSTDQLVDAENYKRFSYLQYKPDNKGSNQDRKTAEDLRAARSWLQTHDVQGTANWNDDGGMLFTPVAGAATSSTKGNYTAVLYAWFGGSYNGQSYTVRNVSIKTKSFYVGLFAATAGADIRNIILRGDSSDAYIQRDTSAADTEGAYFIGGLVGLALNYQNEQNATKTITNCAISGYRVVDTSKNTPGKGEVCIGGLIGMANVNLKNCSAVTNIEVDPKYEGRNASAGNYIRVGGLVGGLIDTIENCYSGGSIDVGEDVLNEAYRSNNNPVSADKEVDLNWSLCTRVFLAGIAGVPFCSKITNFGINVSDKEDNYQMKIYNSYTFMKFPTMRGTICGITMIASLADRHSIGKTPIISNCYYLETSADFKIEPPKYYYHNKTGSDVELPEIGRLSLFNFFNADPQFKEKMIAGDVYYLGPYLGSGDNVPSRARKAPTPSVSKTYSQMSCLDLNGNVKGDFFSKLNAGDGTSDSKPTDVWAPVTAKDKNQVPINGKYSFPSHSSLDGMNYPFPAVVTQTDLTFNVDVKVHYGDWPVTGSYWGEGRATMDIFSDMDKTDGTGVALKSFMLYVDPSLCAGSTNPNTVRGLLSVEGNSVVQIDKVEYVGRTADGYDQHKVTVKALQEGFATIYFNKAQDPGAYFSLHVTANWGLSAVVAVENDDVTVFDPLSNTLRLRLDGTCTARLKLQAHDSTKTKFFENSDALTWTEPPEFDEKVVSCSFDDRILNSDPTVLNVKRLENGTTIVTVTATYKYNGHPNTRQLYINVEMPSMVGLSNAVLDENGNPTSPAYYKEVSLGGKEKIGGEAQFKPIPGYQVPVNFFLYTEKKDTFLDNPANIASIVVNDGSTSEKLQPGQVGDNYYLELNDSTTHVDKFAFLGGALYYINQEPASGQVAVTVTLQSGYSLTTTIPRANIKPAALFTLTLDKGGVESFDFVMNITREENRLSSVPEYSTHDYSKFDTDASSAWSLDGWYTTRGANGKKVLNEKGEIVCDSVPGIVSGKKFVQKGRAKLYARWKTTKTAWTLADKIIEGNKYLIVNSKTPGATASVIYQKSDVDTSSRQRGVYLGEDFVHIADEGGTPYIENYAGSVDGRFLWEATETTISGMNITGLKNVEHQDWFVDNDNNVNGKYSATATNEGNLEPYMKDGTKDWQYKRVSAKLDSKGSLALETNPVRYSSDYVFLVWFENTTNGSPLYLYEQSGDLEVYSSSYYPELTLNNGAQVHSVTKALIDSENKATITRVTGTMPADSTSWTLLGWYDSKSESAQKVLNADGSVVGDSFSTFTGDGKVAGGKLELKDDVTLYAKWRSVKKDNIYVRVNDPSELESMLSEASTPAYEYAIVDGVGSLMLNGGNKIEKLKKWNQILSTSTYVNEAGLHIDAFYNPEAKCRWSIQKDATGSGYTLSVKNGSAVYYLCKGTNEFQIDGEYLVANKGECSPLKLVWDGQALKPAGDDSKCVKFIPSTLTNPDDKPYEKTDKYTGSYWALVNYKESPPLSIYRRATENVYKVSWDAH